MADLPPVVTISTGIYGLLLKAYPKSFRREFGKEMANVFSDLLIDAMQKQGLLGIVNTWFRVLGDFFFSVAGQHTLILRGRLTMLRSTWIKPFLASVCTTFAIIAALAVVNAAYPSKRAAALRAVALSAEAAPLVPWDGTLDGFPDGAKLSDAKESTFNTLDGTRKIELPTVTW